MEELWNFFDGHITCINLISRDDRYEESKKIFEKYSIPVKYLRVEKNPVSGTKGNLESHQRVIKEAYDAGAERVLVFEDDIDVIEGTLNYDNLKRCIDFMKEFKDWDLLYLGVIPDIINYKCQKTKKKGIYKLHGICAHAYIVNRKAMKNIINLKYEGMCIDGYYVRFFKSYAIYPTIFHQGVSKSDISNNEKKWWYKYHNNENIITFYKFIEFYAYHINYPIKAFIPLIIILGIWFLFILYKYYSRKNNTSFYEDKELYNGFYILAFILVLLLVIMIFYDKEDSKDTNYSNLSIKK